MGAWDVMRAMNALEKEKLSSNPFTWSMTVDHLIYSSFSSLSICMT